VLTVAAALEKASEHPLAQAILQRARIERIVPPAAEIFWRCPVWAPESSERQSVFDRQSIIDE